jgi:hypothetical protein
LREVPDLPERSAVSLGEKWHFSPGETALLSGYLPSKVELFSFFLCGVGNNDYL